MSAESLQSEYPRDSEPPHTDMGEATASADVRGLACLATTMEDLSGLQPRVTLSLLLNVMLRRLPQTSAAGTQSILAYIRASDKAVAEYEAARLAAAELNPSGPYSALLRTLDHLESCISAVAKCHRLLPVLKANLGRPGMPDNIRKRLEHQGKAFTEPRNAIEHVEGEILQAIKHGRGATLYFADGCEGLIVAGLSVDFATLTRALRLQHELSEFLAGYQQDDAS